MDNLKVCPMCGQIHKVVDDEWGTIYCCNGKTLIYMKDFFIK